MAPRRQPQRQTQVAASYLDPEVIAKRTKRHLDELEKSNYAEQSAGLEDDDDAPGGRSVKGKARQFVISDKREWPGMPKKKSSHNVRTAVLYKKNLEKLIDESGIANYPPEVPTYLSAAAPPPREPPRLICSVCGYWGKYKCRKCAMPYCDLNCEGVHNETRCERRVM
ncbi:uncharacterized protein B0H18DRAFT_245675 [Fomitopsis serialis]|uniref:uncharacterized protein n=1 Tax=Fomitopsis serialis TaxID=139415 RepID=UPI00200729EA|nr:uncharacterized protein B0H18DRAFT_245675 [Neoantrodia serialis]KAH9928687.1 hypothetical protein B0H18DRAFT_245675 [Neoantrodia serialis]